MRIAKLFLISLAVLIALPAAAQHYDPDHAHAIEISSGFPSVPALLLGQFKAQEFETGIKEETRWRQSLNLGYTYAISEKWDFNAVLGLSTQIYGKYQYPMQAVSYEDGTTGQAPDFSADPTYEGLDFRWVPSIMADFRWKWYRSDSVRLYSSFGLGFVPDVELYGIPVLPYLSPIGINFGRKKLYGLAEVNVSPAATFALVGLGYRF